eukprot:gene5591-23692_t
MVPVATALGKCPIQTDAGSARRSTVAQTDESALSSSTPAGGGGDGGGGEGADEWA